jgi:hypothetical protein
MHLLQKFPGNKWILRNLCLSVLDKEDLKLANVQPYFKDLESTCSTELDHAVYMFLRGRIMLSLNNYSQAIELFEQAM